MQFTVIQLVGNYGIPQFWMYVPLPCVVATSNRDWKSILNAAFACSRFALIINHCLGLGHETMVCAVGLTMFLW